MMIWTEAVYDLVFNEMIIMFGKYNPETWHGNRPASWTTAEAKTAYQQIQVNVTRTSVDHSEAAVEVMINHGFSFYINPSINSNGDHRRTMRRKCRAAALRTGFMNHDDLNYLEHQDWKKIAVKLPGKIAQQLTSHGL